MRKLVVLTALPLLLALASGCALFPSGSSTQSDLNKTVAAQWAAYASGKAGFGGGAAVYIISPKGSYYAAASMPGGERDQIVHRRRDHAARPAGEAAY
jgi:hypothetical protein